MKKALLIGGTGTISAAISRQLLKEGWSLTVLNRGSRSSALPEGARLLQADINDEAAVLAALGDETFDAVAEFIGFVPAQVERDIRLFAGRCGQYLYISSASAYHKPPADYLITESTTLYNPFWQYSRDKIACEEVLLRELREQGFPVTIVRPSHTYDERSVPVGIHGDNGSWQVVQRILEGKPVLIPGDGTSLWTVTHNSDFARGFVGLMSNPHAIGEAFHITSDETLTWNQIYATIARVLGRELIPYHVASDFLAEIGPYDPRGGLLGDKANSVVFDNSKLKRAVPGFSATVRFEQGARLALDNLLAHPELQRPDPAFDAWCDRVVEALERAKRELRR